MSRDDGLLYSGASSQTAARRKEYSQEKKQERKKLQPAAEFVLQEIAKEKAMLGELLLSIVDPEAPDEKVASQLVAVRLHRAWLASFESRIRNVLREPKEENEQ